MASDRKAAAAPVKSHYETLGLEKNCTEKQVKAAFIRLSKVHHPDLNPSDPSKKEKFVRIYEAYEVLSRPQRRLVYDSLLHREKVRPEYGDGLNVKSNQPQYRKWRDESIWSMRYKPRQDFNDDGGSYYGIKGVKRVSNNWIAGGVIFMMVIGTLLHVTAIKYSADFTVTRMDTLDERNARVLFAAKRKAIKNGNQQQIESLVEQLGSAEMGAQTKRTK